MRRKANLGPAIALTAAIGVFGVVDRLEAEPDGSQRLRGLEDRVFFVSVDIEVPGVGVFPFADNCYDFAANGKWSETLVPDWDGDWAQDSIGSKTSYSVLATDSAGQTLRQDGWVTPAGGSGVLQLVAVSTVDGLPFIFHSEGAEIDRSLKETRCFPD